MSGVQMITVGEDDGDQRLDRWLRRMFPHLSQGRVEKMCRKGELRVEGGRVKASSRIEVGQVVRVPPLPDSDHKPAQIRTRISDADAKMIQSCVIYRDDQVIALNKPFGLPVQGGSGQSRHVDGLADARSIVRWSLACRRPIWVKSRRGWSRLAGTANPAKARK